MSKETNKTEQITSSKNTCLVAVYGSLLTGLHNHSVMKDAQGVLVGEDTTYPDYQMVSLGGFPGLFDVGQGKGIGIKIEVYEVPESGLKGPLDWLEGYSEDDERGSMYIRKKINTSYGESWIYLYNSRSEIDAFKDRVVTSGDWKSYYQGK